MQDFIGKDVLLIDVFHGGSHKVLTELLFQDVPSCYLVTMSPKKWHWRARTAALHLSFTIPNNHNFKKLFCTSVLNLAELMALRPDLSSLHKVIYFHENQLIYPVRKQQDRDFQYGYNQILSCLVANIILFNSKFNMDSFLNGITSFLKLMPDYRPPKNLPEILRSKSNCLFFPINISVKDFIINKRAGSLHIAWPHRWEHDKDPELFFRVLYKVFEVTKEFRLSVFGQSFKDCKNLFDDANSILKEIIVSWGFVESKSEYYSLLNSVDLVVSTAKHEFFGSSMVEATTLGCYPLCPNRLVYPEIFPELCLYNDENHLYNLLIKYIHNPFLVRNKGLEIDLKKYSWDTLGKEYITYFKL